MMLSAYKLLTTLGAPLISVYLDQRKKKGKEHPTRFPERLGNPGRSRPNGKLVWIHGASVGEAQSVLPLIQKLLEKDETVHVLLTTGTVTSAELIAKNANHPRLIHQFIPVDRLPFVRKFLNHWNPDLAVWLESDLWPNMVMECHETKTPMVLLNARLSDKSYKTWQRYPKMIQTLLSCFKTVYAQSAQDQLRYQDLGAKTVEYLGNLKFAAPALPYDEDEFQTLNMKRAGRPIWMMASSHAGEEAQAMAVHIALKKKFPNLLTLIAPRHPQRGDEIISENAALGLKIVQRSKSQKLEQETDIYLLDTLGEMGLFYRLSPIVFMGKSLKPLGGQNPLEPARLDCAIMCGPFMSNFAEIMDHFKEEEGIFIVENEQQWIEQLDELLSDPNKVETLSVNAKKVVNSKGQILGEISDRLLEEMNKGEVL